MAGISIPELELGIYEHYKGKRYEVIGIGISSEDETAYVIYKPLYETDVPFWIRPYEMFSETVEVNGNVIPRFKKIDE